MNYQLRFRINKHSFEVIGNYPTPSLAYGMRKKFIQEQPKTYPANKLYVRTEC